MNTALEAILDYYKLDEARMFTSSSKNTDLTPLKPSDNMNSYEGLEQSSIHTASDKKIISRHHIQEDVNT